MFGWWSNWHESRGGPSLLHIAGACVRGGNSYGCLHFETRYLLARTSFPIPYPALTSKTQRCQQSSFHQPPESWVDHTIFASLVPLYTCNRNWCMQYTYMCFQNTIRHNFYVLNVAENFADQNKALFLRRSPGQRTARFEKKDKGRRQCKLEKTCARFHGHKDTPYTKCCRS